METAIKTVIEMITQRGYKIITLDDDKIIGSNPNNELIVLFTQPVIKFNIERVKEYISLLHNLNINQCIVIYTDNVTATTKKLVENSVDLKIELFTQEELQYNITKHRLVPEHIRLETNDANKFKKEYGLKHPVLLRSDPVCRFYSFNRGDIIKIVRKIDGNEFITYRIVK